MKKILMTVFAIGLLAGVELYACTSWDFANGCTSTDCGAGCVFSGFGSYTYICRTDPVDLSCCECKTRFRYCVANGGGDCPTGNGLERTRYECNDCACNTSHQCI